MKKFFSILLTILLGVIIYVPVYANTMNEYLPEGVYHSNYVYADDTFINFIDAFFEDSENRFVYDEFGNDVTTIVLPDIKEMWEVQNYDAIANYISSGNYVMGIENIIQARAYERKNYSKSLVGYSTDSTGAYKVFWQVNLTGTYTYNGNTYEITQADNPKLSLVSCSLDTENVSLYEPAYLGSVTAYSPVISQDKAKVTFSVSF